MRVENGVQGGSRGIFYGSICQYSPTNMPPKSVPKMISRRSLTGVPIRFEDLPDTFPLPEPERQRRLTVMRQNAVIRQVMREVSRFGGFD
jgi:hypothetical protein